MNLSKVLVLVGITGAIYVVSKKVYAMLPDDSLEPFTRAPSGQPCVNTPAKLKSKNKKKTPEYLCPLNFTLVEKNLCRPVGCDTIIGA